MFIHVTSVPDEKAEVFEAILRKPQRFYIGYVRFFRCKGEEYEIDTRYDADLIAAGLIDPDDKSLRP